MTTENRANLVRGRGQFLADVPLTDVLEAAFVRSPLAFARIHDISVPDGHGITGADLAAELKPLRIEGHGLSPTDWYPLATDAVRYVGEPFAIVWANNRYAAEDLVEQVTVEYDDLPASTPIHHEVPDGVFFEFNFERGDVDAAFRGAHQIFERTFSNARVSAMPMEARGVAATWDGRKLTVWTSTQIPDIVRTAIASALGMAEDLVRVVVPDVGGGFGQKAHVFAEEIAIAATARRLGRAVRWIEDRRENLLAGSHAHDTEVTLRVAVTREGRLLAVDHATVHDAGAHPIYPHSPLSETITCAFSMFGPYEIGAVRLAARAIASNKCPAGVHRGVGVLAGLHATERMMDEIASALGLDPVEIRRRNAIPSLPGESAHGGDISSGDYAALLNVLTDVADYGQLRATQAQAREEGRLVGIGVTLFNEGSGVSATDYRNRALTSITGYDASRVIIKDNGNIEIRTSAAEAGQGHAATYREIARQVTGLSADRIDVIEGDTDLCPRGTGTFSSRGAVGVFESLVQALRAACQAGLRPGTDVTATVDQMHEVAQCAALAVVEIDTVSFIPRVQRLIFVHDCGRVVMEELVAGQIQGGAANGIGCVLLEAHAYGDDEQILTATMVDYLLPLAADVPDVEIYHYESLSPHNSIGSKGCGEVGTIAPHGAVANAVVDALAPTGRGHRLRHLPYTPQSIFDVITAQA